MVQPILTLAALLAAFPVCPARADEKVHEEADRLEQEVELGPYLESLAGIPFVRVRTADGKVKEVRSGAFLEPGDRLQTGPKGSARLVFEDGSQALVGTDSGVAVRGLGNVPVIELEQGEVRALVPPAEKPAGKHKFLIRTRTAVMGVRGTDFVVKSDAETSSVHTLSGEVEMALDEAGLGSPAAVLVPENHFTDAFAKGRVLNRARQFDVGAFVSELNRRHPKLEGMWNTASRDQKTGRLAPLFRGRRERKAEELGTHKGASQEVIREIHRRSKEQGDETRDSEDRDGRRPGRHKSRISEGLNHKRSGGSGEVGRKHQIYVPPTNTNPTTGPKTNGAGGP